MGAYVGTGLCTCGSRSGPVKAGQPSWLGGGAVGSSCTVPEWSRSTSCGSDGGDHRVFHRSGLPHEKYEIEELPIGEGTFGSVRRSIPKDSVSGQPVLAIKSVAKEAIGSSVHNEVDMQRRLKHSNIARLVEVYEGPDHVHLAMEICHGGELHDAICEHKFFEEEVAKVLAVQVFRAVAHIHSKGVVHRDIKPENFLLAKKDVHIKENILKLCDFGCARRFSRPGKVMRTRVGTAEFIAPEVLRGRYNETIDEWSAGVVLYIMLCGQSPFTGDSDLDVIKKVDQCEIPYPADQWALISEEAQELVRSVCERNAKKRATADVALISSWLQDMSPTGKLTRKNSDQLLSNVRNYCHSSKAGRYQQQEMRLSALRILAQRADDELVGTLRQALVALDVKKDGLLPVAVFHRCCTEIGLEGLEGLEGGFQKDDANGKPCVDYLGFLAACLDERAVLKDEVCWEVFCSIDRDGDGKVSVCDLREALQLQPHVDTETIDLIIDKANFDNSGHLSFGRFVDVMQVKRQPFGSRLAAVLRNSPWMCH